MAGIGLAIGAGMYGVGIFATILIMVIQIFTHGNLQRLDGPVYDSFSITYRDAPAGLEELKAQLKERHILIHHIQMEKMEDGGVKVKLEVSREHTITCTDLADLFVNDDNIKSFRL